LSDILRDWKGVSAELALRAWHAFAIPEDYLMRLQSDFDFPKAWHKKNDSIAKEDTPVVARDKSQVA